MKGLSVIIAASGNGLRFLDNRRVDDNNNTPKQFRIVDDDFLIRKVVNSFLSIDIIDEIICVIPREYVSLYNDIFKDIDDRRLKDPVFGGKTRQESVYNGLMNVHYDYVMIHDAARCYVDRDTIYRVIDKLYDNTKCQAVVPVVDVIDSYRFENKSIDRNKLKIIQTPQGFETSLIKRLHEKYKDYHDNITDDASLCDIEDIEVAYVDGNKDNIKITYTNDIKDNNKPHFRIGFGYDVHPFSKDPDRRLIICGIEIDKNDCKYGLDGISDADVVIHSLVDAIFGALCMGSIGEYFDPNDKNMINKNSREFLEFANKKIMEHGYNISNIDITIVCEEPKISKYRNIMQNSIASIMNINKNIINIKGKTTEKLGFTGRKEGIASYCNILLYK